MFFRNRLAAALFTATFALAAIPGRVHAEPPAAIDLGVRERLAGQYVYAGGEAQRAQLEAAIDRATDGMFFVAKPIARSKLRDKTQIKSTVGFSFAHGAITSTASDVAPATSPDDGRAVAYVAAGESLQLSQKLTANGHLLQTFAASEGTRTNDYSVSTGGDVLTVAITVSSSKLTRPVRYTLTYRRK